MTVDPATVRGLYNLPHYRWSYSAGVWVLQGLHRLAPIEVYPSNLRPAPEVRPLMLEDDAAAWLRRLAWEQSDGFAKPLQRCVIEDVFPLRMIGRDGALFPGD